MNELNYVKYSVEMDLHQHFGKPMHKERGQLICHTGDGYGVQPIPEYWGQPMNINDFNKFYLIFFLFQKF